MIFYNNKKLIYSLHYNFEIFYEDLLYISTFVSEDQKNPNCKAIS